MSKARGLADLGNAYSDGALSNRNLIINGAMQVAQRGTSSTSNGVHTVDRFFSVFGTGAITQSQQSLSSSDDPYAQGFRSSFRVTVTTASSSATSFMQIEHKIEAQNISQSGWEYTNPNSYLTFSFWAKSSLAGTYYAQFRTADGTSYYHNKSFTLASNTWSKVTCTIPGNSNLTIDNNNEEGLRVLVIPDYGTDYSGHAEAVEDAWYARSQNSGYTPSFAQDWHNTSGATFEITGVQLEVGDRATPFEHRSYGDELARCQRYYFQGTKGSYPEAYHYYAMNNTAIVGNIAFPVTMRATPSVTINSNGIDNRAVRVNTAALSTFSPRQSWWTASGVAGLYDDVNNPFVSGESYGIGVKVDAEL